MNYELRITNHELRIMKNKIINCSLFTISLLTVYDSLPRYQSIFRKY